MRLLSLVTRLEKIPSAVRDTDISRYNGGSIEETSRYHIAVMFHRFQDGFYLDPHDAERRKSLRELDA